MGPTSDILFAASPSIARKLSSLIGVRAKPTIAYLGPSELWLAKSYISGMTLRLARSPDAPDKTTVHGSAAPAAPARFASTSVVSPPLASTSPSRNQWRSTLYLNVVLLQITPQLLRVLIVDHVHSQPPRALQIQRPVIDKHALFGQPVRHFQRHTKDQLLWLARTNVTRAEENQEISAQIKRLDAVLVELQRLVIDCADKIFLGARHNIQNRARFPILLRLREHECRELFSRKRARTVKQRPVQILVQRDVPGIKGGKRQFVAVLKLFPIQIKNGSRLTARPAIPAVGEDDASNVPKQRRNFRQVCYTSAPKGGLRKRNSIRKNPL